MSEAITFVMNVSYKDAYGDKVIEEYTVEALSAARAELRCHKEFKRNGIRVYILDIMEWEDKYPRR